MSWPAAAAASASRPCARAAARAAQSSSRSRSHGLVAEPVSVAEGVADELLIPGVVDRVVDVVHRRQSVVLGVHLFRRGRRGTFGEGQDHVGKNLEADLAQGVGPGRLWIPRMNTDRVRELIAGCTIRIADLENGGAGSIGAPGPP